MMGKNKKAGVLVFPGTNCERDLKMTLEHYGFKVDFLWHTGSFNVEHDVYFVPGGFSYGDYLRSGSLAARSLSMKSLFEAAKKGVTTVGICNGFQILTESHLLPGALIKNHTLKHICRWVPLESSGVWSGKLPGGYSLPVSHSEGNYIAEEQTIEELESTGRVILRYGEVVNGSTNNIAGICDKSGKIIGLMPHPERAIFSPNDNEYFRQDPGQSPGNLFFQTVFSNM